SLVTVASLLHKAGQTDDALATCRKAESLLAVTEGSASTADPVRETLASIRWLLGRLLHYTGYTEQGLACLRQARGEQEALASLPGATIDVRRDLAGTLRVMGDQLFLTGKPFEAESEYRQALRVLQKLVDDNPAVPEFQCKLAHCHNNLGI